MPRELKWPRPCLAAFLLTSAAAAASPPIPTASCGWPAIRSDSRVEIAQTALAGSFGPQGWFNACLDGDRFRSLEPVQGRAVELPVHQQAETDCVQWAYGPDAGPDGAGGVRCVRFNVIPYRLPTSPVFSIFQLAPSDGGASGVAPSRLLFRKLYEIPACPR